jgi:hypothetical protein
MTFVLFYHSFIVVSQKQAVHENQEVTTPKRPAEPQLFAIRIQGGPRSRVHIMSAMLSSRFYQPANRCTPLSHFNQCVEVHQRHQLIHSLFLSFQQ